MRRPLRFWLVYGIAWLPYAASNVALFVTHLGRTFFEAIKGSILNVLPAALLGVGVVAVCQRLHWSPNRRYRFLSAHLGFASIRNAFVAFIDPLSSTWTTSSRVDRSIVACVSHSVTVPK